MTELEQNIYVGMIGGAMLGGVFGGAIGAVGGLFVGGLLPILYHLWVSNHV